MTSLPFPWSSPLSLSPTAAAAAAAAPASASPEAFLPHSAPAQSTTSTFAGLHAVSETSFFVIGGGGGGGGLSGEPGGSGHLNTQHHHHLTHHHNHRKGSHGRISPIGFSPAVLTQPPHFVGPGSQFQQPFHSSHKPATPAAQTKAPLRLTDTNSYLLSKPSSRSPASPPSSLFPSSTSGANQRKTAARSNSARRHEVSDRYRLFSDLHETALPPPPPLPTTPAHADPPKQPITFIPAAPAPMARSRTSRSQLRDPSLSSSPSVFTTASTGAGSAPNLQQVHQQQRQHHQQQQKQQASSSPTPASLSTSLPSPFPPTGSSAAASAQQPQQQELWLDAYSARGSTPVAAGGVNPTLLYRRTMSFDSAMAPWAGAAVAVSTPSASPAPMPPPPTPVPPHGAGSRRSDDSHRSSESRDSAARRAAASDGSGEGEAMLFRVDSDGEGGVPPVPRIPQKWVTNQFL